MVLTQDPTERTQIFVILTPGFWIVTQAIVLRKPAGFETEQTGRAGGGNNYWAGPP